MLNPRQVDRALDLFERMVDAMETIAEAAAADLEEEEAGVGVRPDTSRDDN